MTEYRSTYRAFFTATGNMLRQPWMLQAVLPVAHEALVIAQVLSPTGHPDEDRHPGLYRASFRVRYTVKNIPYRGKPARRVIAQLVNTANHAGIVEYGNGKTQRYAVLAQTLDAMKGLHGDA